MPISINLDDESLAETAAVFALLSRIWSSELDAKTLQAISQPPLAEAWKSLGGATMPATDASAIEELAVDYCQLLIGPKNHISPNQSIWEQKRFSGDATGSMHKYLQMVDGFEPSVEMIDHIGVQMQFAGVLLSMAEQAKRKLIRGLARAYFADHLEWCEPFFGRVEEQADTDFYRTAASVSRQFLFG